MLINTAQLTADFKKLELTANVAGVTIEELAVILIGLNTNQDNTLGYLANCIGLESLLRIVISKTPESIRALEDHGVYFGIDTVKAQGLVEALKSVFHAVRGDRRVLADILPDTLAYAVALALLKIEGLVY